MLSWLLCLTQSWYSVLLHHLCKPQQLRTRSGIWLCYFNRRINQFYGPSAASGLMSGGVSRCQRWNPSCHIKSRVPVVFTKVLKVKMIRGSDVKARVGVRGREIPVRLVLGPRWFWTWWKMSCLFWDLWIPHHQDDVVLCIHTCNLNHSADGFKGAKMFLFFCFSAPFQDSQFVLFMTDNPGIHFQGIRMRQIWVLLSPEAKIS